jgi:hypothetical protein
VAALEAQQWRASTERSLEYARSLGAKAAVTLQVQLGVCVGLWSKSMGGCWLLLPNSGVAPLYKTLPAVSFWLQRQMVRIQYQDCGIWSFGTYFRGAGCRKLVRGKRGDTRLAWPVLRASHRIVLPAPGIHEATVVLVGHSFAGLCSSSRADFDGQECSTATRGRRQRCGRISVQVCSRPKGAGTR